MLRPGYQPGRSDPACGLKHILAGGVAAFMAHLDQFSVADLVTNRALFAQALGLRLV